jgi:hypothetical protein
MKLYILGDYQEGVDKIKFFFNWTSITGSLGEELCVFLSVYESQVVNIDYKKQMKNTFPSCTS